jgi:hypothetical protein
VWRIELIAPADAAQPPTMVRTDRRLEASTYPPIDAANEPIRHPRKPSPPGRPLGTVARQRPRSRPARSRVQISAPRLEKCLRTRESSAVSRSATLGGPRTMVPIPSGPEVARRFIRGHLPPPRGGRCPFWRASSSLR